MTGIERWESHECNKPGQMRKDCSVCKKRIAEKGNEPKGKRVATTAAVQGLMVETLKYDDGKLIENRFGFVSELTTRDTTPGLSTTSGSSIEQRGYKKVHWTERGFNTLVESSRSVLVRSVLSLKMNGTSVAFTRKGDYDPSRQPKPLLQSSGVSLLIDQTRSGTCWMQANWRVTAEGKSSVNKMTGVFPSQIIPVQEDGATSSTDVAELVTDFTEVYKTLKESTSVEQGQLLRAAEPDQCVLKVKTQRQRDTVEFTHSLLGVKGRVADDLHRQQQDSDLEDAPSDRTDIAVESGRDKVLVNHDHGSVTAMTGPNEVTVYTVRVGCDRLDEWRSGVCSLKGQNETAEITLLNTGHVETSQENSTNHAKVFA